MQINRQTDMKKLLVAFCNFANSPKMTNVVMKLGH